jgi:hypothetical protein
MRWNGTAWVCEIAYGDPANASIVAVANGGSGTATGSIAGTGALTFAAGGANQNVTLTPSGTGYTVLNGRVGIGTTSPQATLEVNGTVRLARSSSQPSSCSASNDGTLAMTSGYITCVCRAGTGWVQSSDGVTVCHWSESGKTTISYTATEGASCTMSGSLARDATERLLSCQAGVWKTIGLVQEFQTKWCALDMTADEKLVYCQPGMIVYQSKWSDSVIVGGLGLDGELVNLHADAVGTFMGGPAAAAGCPVGWDPKFKADVLTPYVGRTGVGINKYITPGVDLGATYWTPSTTVCVGQSGTTSYTNSQLIARTNTTYSTINGVVVKKYSPGGGGTTEYKCNYKPALYYCYKPF